MFTLIKILIWIVGLAVITLFILDYFGYEVNRSYFDESKEECLERLKECKDEYITQGTENAECDFNCVDPRLIIKKSSTENE